MKRLITAIAGFFILFCSTQLHAQAKTGADFFVGKWTVLVKGTPQGDVKMVFVVDKKDSTLTGVVQDTTGNEISKLDKVELGDNSITFYFNAQGYDLNLAMTKKDEDHLTGSLLGMFDAEAERKKS